MAEEPAYRLELFVPPTDVAAKIEPHQIIKVGRHRNFFNSNGRQLSYGRNPLLLAIRKDSNVFDIPIINDERPNNDDLRTVLLGKRKVSEEYAKNKGGKNIFKKKIVVHVEVQHESAPIGPTQDILSRSRMMTFTNNYLPMLECLRSLARPATKPNQVWYIVPDFEVMLREMAFLADFVQLDKLCKLIIPETLFNKVLGFGGAIGSNAELCGKNINTWINSPQVCVQPTAKARIEYSLHDVVIKCCMEIMGKDNHAVILSNNPELLATAKCYSIYCCNMNNIKQQNNFP